MRVRERERGEREREREREREGRGVLLDWGVGVLRGGVNLETG